MSRRGSNVPSKRRVFDSDGADSSSGQPRASQIDDDEDVCDQPTLHRPRMTSKDLSQAYLQLVDEILVLKQDAIAWLELLVVAQLLDVVRLLAHQFDRVLERVRVG